MGIPSVAALARAARRTQRRVNSVQAVLNQMQGGAALHLHIDRHGPVWVLSGGREVLPDTAEVVITSPSVAPADDCLFGGMHSQTYQWNEKESENGRTKEETRSGGRSAN